MAEPEPKIIVDSDWKTQAQAERERLAAKEKQAPVAAGAPAGPAGTPGEPHAHPELPPASFDELLRMLITQALMYLGAFPDPETGRAVVALDLAKFNIDLLGVLQDKTKGNLTDTESQTLTKVLHELRMQYVETTKAVARAIEQGRIGKGATPAPAGVVIDPARAGRST